MSDQTIQPNGKRIKELREKLGLSQQELVDKCDGLRKPLSKRTLENAEANKNLKKDSLETIACGLETTLDDVMGVPIAKDGKSPRDRSEQHCGDEHLHFFGFGQRSAAIDLLINSAKKKNSNRARVICFTGHTLDPLLMGLLQVGVTHIDIFMGTKEMARRLVSRRQEDLLSQWWVPHLSDLYRHIADGRITIRYYDCPPSFTGVALNQEAYLMNGYIWMPTLNWLRHKNVADYEEHWDTMDFPHRPHFDDYTLNGCDMPCTLSVGGGDGLASQAFDAISRTFELVWKTYERDFDRTSESGRERYRPFEEMVLLQERLTSEEQEKIDSFRSPSTKRTAKKGKS